MQANVLRGGSSVVSRQCGLRTLAAWLSLAGFLIFAPARAAPCAEAAHDFEKWEREISAYERMDITNPPPKGALVFIGSSTILRWKTLAQDFPEHQVINRGFGGSEIVDSTHFAGRIIFPYQPRMVFLRAGGNDLWAGKSVEQVFADYKEFVAKLQAKLPEADVVFISLSPSPARWAQRDKEKAVNTLIEAYTERTRHLKYVEDYDMVLGPDGKVRPELFVEDKLHFNAEGYKLLVERVRPYLPK